MANFTVFNVFIHKEHTVMEKWVVMSHKLRTSF